VERPADGGRRRVNRKHLGARPRSVEAIRAFRRPAGVPFGFETFEGGLFRKGDGVLGLAHIGHLAILGDAGVNRRRMHAGARQEASAYEEGESTSVAPSLL